MFFPGVAGGRRGSPGVAGENSGGGPGKIRGRPGLFDLFRNFGGSRVTFITRASPLLFLGQSARGVAGEAFRGRDSFPGVAHPGFCEIREIREKSPKNSRKLSLWVEKPVPPQYNPNSDFSWTPTSTFDGVHFDRLN